MRAPPKKEENQSREKKKEGKRTDTGTPFPKDMIETNYDKGHDRNQL
jgi:hypothetical protein